MMASTEVKLLVVTDLDGTLLDETYSWQPARESLAVLRERHFPLILNSSKTVSELAALAATLQTEAPFVAENGGVVAIPIDSVLHVDMPKAIQFGGYHLLLPGLTREFILEQAHRLRREEKYRFEGFADWTTEEVAARTGLDASDAARSRQRWATEPIVWLDSELRWEPFREALAAHGIRALRGGRFFHLMGHVDKAGGLTLLRDLYRQAYPEYRWQTVALGDSENDLAMLTAADISVVIPDGRGRYLAPAGREVVQATRSGPEGWQEAMSGILQRLYDDYG